MKIVKDPVYFQLACILRELIGSQKYPSGSKFMTEREISSKYDVSRATANKVLAGLVSEGELEFRKGIGTFVRNSSLRNELNSLVSFTSRAKKNGLLPKTRVLKMRMVRKSELEKLLPDTAVFPVSAEIMYVKRLRLASGVPVILENRYLFLPAEKMPGESELSGSLYSFLCDRHSVKIVNVEQSIRAVLLNKEDSGLLEVKNGFPALEITAAAYDDTGRMVWFEQTLYRSDMYVFRNSIPPGKSSHEGASLFETEKMGIQENIQ